MAFRRLKGVPARHSHRVGGKGPHSGPGWAGIIAGYTFDHMTVTESATGTGPARPGTRPPRAGRSNGQWKVDGTEPLNGNEAWKQEDGGLNVRERIEQVYSREGFASIPPQDLPGRFRWWGLYTQRRPGIDGGQHGPARADTELSDEYFMLRVRLDGGAIGLAQLRVLAEIATSSAAARQTSATARTSSALDPRRGRPRDLAPPRGRRPPDDRGLRRHPPRHPRLARSPASRRTRSSTRRRSSARSSTATSATPSSPTCRASSRRPSPATRAWTSCTRSTTSPSSASSTPSSASATTSGSAVASRRAPASAERVGVFVRPEEAAEVWHGVVGSSATTATAACATRPASSSSSPSGAPRSSARCSRTSTSSVELPDGPPPAHASGPGDHVGVAPAEGRQALHRRRPHRRAHQR